MLPMVEIIVAVILTLLFITIPAAMLYFTLKKNKADFTVGGIKFQCEPKTMVSLIDKEEIKRFLEIYSVNMIVVFGITTQQLNAHFSKLCCTFKKGYLSNKIRSDAGLADSNNDGVAERITGLTFSPNLINVAVIFPDDDITHSMIDETGKVKLNRTALMYELNNSVMQNFKGYNVSLMEVFMDPKDVRMQKILHATEAELKALKDERAKYDQAFFGLKF